MSNLDSALLLEHLREMQTELQYLRSQMHSEFKDLRARLDDIEGIVSAVYSGRAQASSQVSPSPVMEPAHRMNSLIEGQSV